MFLPPDQTCTGCNSNGFPSGRLVHRHFSHLIPFHIDKAYDFFTTSVTVVWNGVALGKIRRFARHHNSPVVRRPPTKTTILTICLGICGTI